MQLRCMETHRPLPGVVVGDIGPKLGYNGVDNGFLRFNHVRIPRSHLLARYSQVTRDGKVRAPSAGQRPGVLCYDDVHPRHHRRGGRALPITRAHHCREVRGPGSVLSGGIIVVGMVSVLPA